jgi:anaerobic magnesium-protoporphyrin IX monomethyl ester cyclase
MPEKKKILLVEPPGGYIRLDRCMQSIASWGGVYRFPLNLARIGAHLSSLGHKVHFTDLQADPQAKLARELDLFSPDLCILTSGFPSMQNDAQTATQIKKYAPATHVSTFGPAPTLLSESFFAPGTWGFETGFDSIVTGGEPALGYERLLGQLSAPPKLLDSQMTKVKTVETFRARKFFPHELYRSSFTGERATYIEGTYGCPFRCPYCVVPALYNGRFSKRSVSDIVNEFKYVIAENGVNHITLWDEGTTFNRAFTTELCEALTDLRNGPDPLFHHFVWTTRSTAALIDRDLVFKMKASGLSGITLGLESFDDAILQQIGKDADARQNEQAINLLAEAGIISIGHVILGHLNETSQSIQKTIAAVIASNLAYAQFYCAVPYPGTKLYEEADAAGLIRERDLLKYELCNPIMNTYGKVSHTRVGAYRAQATKKFWTRARWSRLNLLIHRGSGITGSTRKKILSWKDPVNSQTHD